MASSGWVWFVTDRHGKTGVLPTFGAGTLLIRSRSNVSPMAYKNGGASKQSESSSSNGVRDSSSFSNPSTAPPLGLNRSPMSPNHISPRSIHSDSLDAQPASFFSSDTYAHNLPPNILKVGEIICPLFCVSVHEHAWMSAGYGVWGKEEWLKKFWTVLDWGEVSRSFEKFVPDEQRF
jgi:Fe-Mn family superoxide dismutase